MSTVGTAHPLCTERWRGRGGEDQPTQMRGDGNGIFCVSLQLSLECCAQYYAVLSCLVPVYFYEKLQTTQMVILILNMVKLKG